MAEASAETIDWHGREVRISLRLGWLIVTFCHLEVRCDEKLPITETGYKSHFMPLEQLEGYASPADYVRAWLDHAAGDTAWKRHVEASRQGSLFD